MTHHASLPTVAPTHGRYDIYNFIHKALRKAQCDMLVRLGHTDFTGADAAGVLADLRQLLVVGRGHLAHEEAFVHTALERRAPRSCDALQDQHDDHRDAFAALDAIIAEFATANAAQKTVLGRQLYLTYSAFVARDFEHMLEEETINNAALWAVFSDGELAGIEGAIVASLPPEAAMGSMRMMLPALNHAERVTLLGRVQAHAPRAAFDAIMQHAAQATLSREDFTALEQRLSLAEAYA